MTAIEPPLDQARRLLRLMPGWHRWAAATLQNSRLGQELSLRQLGVLYLIREGLISPTMLSRRLLVTPAVVTGLVDRLEQRGFVRREADPIDRRRQRLVLTESGLAANDAVEQVLAEALARQLGAAGQARLAEIDRALAVIEETLAALTAGVPASFNPCVSEDEELAAEHVDSETRPRSSESDLQTMMTISGAAPADGPGGSRRRVPIGIE